MNDSFETALARLKPGKLPPELKQNLANPPAKPLPFGRMCSAAAVLAAAACFVLLFNHSSPTAGSDSKIPTHAQASVHRVTEVRPLSVFTDAKQRSWKLLEVNWIEEETIISTDRPAIAQVQQSHRMVVPCAIHFD